jgi:FkbM family methyltransferase
MTQAGNPSSAAATLRAFRYYARSLLTLAWRIESPLAVAWALAVRRRTRIVRFRNGLALACRDPMDLWVAKETCLDRDYEVHGTPIGSDWRVIDIGAGIGDFTILAARAARDGFVLACEPSPAAIPLLRENLRRNGVHNVTVMAVAIASQARSVDLVLDRHHATATTVAGTAGRQAVSVAAVPLSSVLDSLPGGRCDLLKSDCEGAEFDFILQANEATLRRIDRIVLEYHDGHGRHHSALISRLDRAGFDELSTWPNPVHANTGLMYARRSLTGADPLNAAQRYQAGVAFREPSSGTR